MDGTGDSTRTELCGCRLRFKKNPKSHTTEGWVPRFSRKLRSRRHSLKTAVALNTSFKCLLTFFDQ